MKNLKNKSWEFELKVENKKESLQEFTESK